MNESISNSINAEDKNQIESIIKQLKEQIPVVGVGLEERSSSSSDPGPNPGNSNLILVRLKSLRNYTLLKPLPVDVLIDAGIVELLHRLELRIMTLPINMQLEVSCILVNILTSEANQIDLICKQPAGSFDVIILLSNLLNSCVGESNTLIKNVTLCTNVVWSISTLIAINSFYCQKLLGQPVIYPTILRLCSIAIPYPELLLNNLWCLNNLCSYATTSSGITLATVAPSFHGNGPLKTKHVKRQATTSLHSDGHPVDSSQVSYLVRMEQVLPAVCSILFSMKLNSFDPQLERQIRLILLHPNLIDQLLLPELNIQCLQFTVLPFIVHLLKSTSPTRCISMPHQRLIACQMLDALIARSIALQKPAPLLCKLLSEFPDLITILYAVLYNSTNEHPVKQFSAQVLRVLTTLPAAVSKLFPDYQHTINRFAEFSLLLSTLSDDSMKLILLLIVQNILKAGYSLFQSQQNPYSMTASSMLLPILTSFAKSEKPENINKEDEHEPEPGSVSSDTEETAKKKLCDLSNQLLVQYFSTLAETIGIKQAEGAMSGAMSGAMQSDSMQDIAEATESKECGNKSVDPLETDSDNETVPESVLV